MREFFDATEAAIELQRQTKLEWTAAQVLREAENGNLPICFQHQGKIGVFTPEESELGQSIFGKALRTTYLPRGSYLRVQGHPVLTNVNKKQVSLCPRNLELVKPARGASEVSVTASETLRIVSESGGFKDTAVAVLQVPSTAWLFHADDLGKFASFKYPAVQIKQIHADVTETAKSRQDRRLLRLRELGGDYVCRGSWQTDRNSKRGALTALIKEEQAAGHPMSDKTDIRKDLEAAAKREREGKLLAV